MSTVKLSLLAQLLCGSLVSGMRLEPMATLSPFQESLYATETLEEAGDIIKDASEQLWMDEEFPADPLFMSEELDWALAGFNQHLENGQEVEEMPEFEVEEAPQVDRASRTHIDADLVLAASGLVSLESQTIILAFSSPAKVDKLLSKGFFAHVGGHDAQVYLSHLLDLPPVELLAIPHAAYIVDCLFHSIPRGLHHLFIAKLFNLPGRAPRTLEEFRLDDAYARLQLELLSQMALAFGETPSYLLDQHADPKRLNYFVIGEFLNHFNRQELFAHARKAYFVEIFEGLFSSHSDFDLEMFDLVVKAGVRFEDVAHFFARAPTQFKEQARAVFSRCAAAMDDDKSLQFGTIPNEPTIFQNTSEFYDPIQSVDF